MMRIACTCFVVVCLMATNLAAQDLPLKDLLIEGEGWKLVGEGYKFTEGPAVDDQGNVFFVDVPESKIYKIDVKQSRAPEVYVADSFRASGLMFGGDGKLYGTCGGNRSITVFDSTLKSTLVCGDCDVNDLCVSKTNHVYYTDPKNHQVWHVAPGGKKQPVDTGIDFPNGIILWPDERTLVVSDHTGKSCWTFRVENDGSLSFKQPYYTMEIASGQKQSGADGMTVDAVGRLYVTTHAGLQVFDTQGRLSGIIAKPQDKFLSNVCFGGEKLDTLYVTCLDKVYSRKIKATGVRNFGEAVK